MKNDGNSGNSNSNDGRHTRAGEAMPPELSGKFYFVFLPFSYWHFNYR
jgi:hypothetical protein